MKIVVSVIIRGSQYVIEEDGVSPEQVARAVKIAISELEEGEVEVKKVIH